MHKIIFVGFAAFTLGSAALSTLSTPAAAAASFSQVKQACDNMNKQKSGSCTMKSYSAKLMAGCAQEAKKDNKGSKTGLQSPVCFQCPVGEPNHLCYAESGRGGKYLNVTVSSSGTLQDAVIRGCDLVASAENQGECHYSIVSRTGTTGSTTVSGVEFECPDNTNCYALPGKRLP